MKASMLKGKEKRLIEEGKERNKKVKKVEKNANGKDRRKQIVGGKLGVWE